MPEQVSVATFDYASLDSDTRRRLEKKAAVIRRNLLNGTRTYLEIGRQLLEVKLLLPHGEFGRWVEANCNFTTHSAQNFMNAAEFVGKHKELSGLDQTAIILLSAPRLDEVVRGRVIEAVQGGMTTAKAIRQMIKDERQAVTPRQDKPPEGEEDLCPALREFASILVSGLSESDFDRVRSIVAGLDGSFVEFAILLNSADRR